MKRERRQSVGGSAAAPSTAGFMTGIDIGSWFGVLDERVAVVDLEEAAVTWCSAAFRACFPTLRPGVSLEQLCHRLDGLAALFVTPREEVERTVVSDRDGSSFAVTRVVVDQGRAVLRLEDLAERERMMRRHLEDRERLLFTSRAISVSEMATTLAHELNQPIGTVANLLRGAVLRLRRQQGEQGGEILEALERAIDQALFAAGIITRIREYTHSFQPRRVEVDLATLAEASTALLDWEIQREGITVTHVRDHRPPFRVLGDEIMLQQVFVNLLRNAIDAMRGIPRHRKNLRIAIRRNHGQIEVSISDSGCGLTPEEEKNLFVPFVSTKPTGMGVGLNICRSFMELHQGRLWVSSNADAGCTFHIALPEAGDGDSGDTETKGERHEPEDSLRGG